MLRFSRHSKPFTERERVDVHCVLPNRRGALNRCPSVSGVCVWCPGEEPAVGRVPRGGVHAGRPVLPPAAGHGPGGGGHGPGAAAQGGREQRLHPAGRGRGAGPHGAALHAGALHQRPPGRGFEVRVLQTRAHNADTHTTQTRTQRRQAHAAFRLVMFSRLPTISAW